MKYSGFVVITHPCAVSNKRAYCTVDITLEAKLLLERNHDIVDNVDIFLATPVYN